MYGVFHLTGNPIGHRDRIDLAPFTLHLLINNAEKRFLTDLKPVSSISGRVTSFK